MGKRQEAIGQFEKALELSPTLGPAHGNLAIQLYYAGLYGKAWDEVRLSRQFGTEPHPGFIAALSRKMPEPR
jgi:lipoprotein NlpI